MALLARRREARMRHRTGRAREIFLVARVARSRPQVEIVVDVAIAALPRRNRVSAGQLEPGHRVIEFGVQPVIGSMALLAVLRREVLGIVLGIDRARIIRLVAGIALGRHRLEFAVRRALVTGIAVDRRMRSRQREAIVMLLDLLYRDFPSQHRVALFAIGAQLPAMNVRMAVLAALPHIGKHRLDVTLRAGHRLVHAAQGIARLIVIEFGDGPDRPPSVGGVAILAGHRQSAVRAVCARILRSRAQRSAKRQQEHCDEFECAPCPQHRSPLCPAPPVHRTAVISVKTTGAIHSPIRVVC